MPEVLKNNIKENFIIKEIIVSPKIKLKVAKQQTISYYIIKSSPNNFFFSIKIILKFNFFHLINKFPIKWR